MRSISIFLVMLGVLVIGNAQNILAADLEAGEEIFTANCAVCHAGGNNALMPEKTLQKQVLEQYGMDSVSAITTQVTNGKNAMPSFGNRLADEDIENVANYVLHQSKQGW